MPTRSLRTLVSLAVLTSAIVLTAACSSRERPSTQSACFQSSECQDGLICALGACRDICTSAADCRGGTCVSSGEHAVCQPAAERNSPCDSPSDCPQPLACASDFRCRNLCVDESDCNTLGLRGRLCVGDARGVRFCADTNEVSEGVLAAEPPPGAPIRAVSGGAASPLTPTRASFVGPEGGVLGFGGLLLRFPAGALETALAVSIVEVPSPAAGALSKAYAVGPASAALGAPVELTFRYPDPMALGVSPAAITRAGYRDRAWSAIDDVRVDEGAREISGKSDTLTIFALVRTDEDAAQTAGASRAAASSAGDQCTGAADCAGVAPVCLTTQTSPGGFSYPGGYCSAACVTDEACNAADSGSHGCPFVQNASGLAPAFCHRRCEGDHDCRAGYRCLTFSALYVLYGLPQQLLRADQDTDSYCLSAELAASVAPGRANDSGTEMSTADSGLRPLLSDAGMQSSDAGGCDPAVCSVRYVGSWRWTSCSPAFSCSIGSDNTGFDLDLLLDEARNTVTGTWSGNTISGSLKGGTISYTVTYAGRTDVHDECFGDYSDTAISGTCTAYYTAGPGTYTFAGTRP